MIKPSEEASASDELLAEAQGWPNLVEPVRPCVVAIGANMWPAVWYKQRLDTPEGSPARGRGEESYLREGFCCLGQLPPVYRYGRVGTFTYDNRDWIIATYKSRRTNWRTVSEATADVERFVLLAYEPGTADAGAKRMPMAVRWYARVRLPGPQPAETSKQRRHRVAPARPHGMCERAGRCVEHERNPRVEACAAGGG